MTPAAKRIDRVGDWTWPAGIFLLALAMRLAFVVDFAHHPLGKLPWVDEGAYWERAGEILGGAWLPDRPFFQDPLYPYVLAVLMRVVGSAVSSLRITLACLGALTPVMVYWAGRRGLGRAEGIVAGLLSAVYGPMIFADGLLEKEGLAALGAATGLWLTACAVEPRGRSWRAAVMGWVWGGVALLRANALVLAPLGALWWWITDRRGASPGRGFARASIYLFGFALAIAPVTIVNALVSRPRELILTTWQGGPNFYIGNGPHATGTYAAPEFVEANPAREADDFAAEAVRRAGRPLTYGGVSRFWLVEALKQWGHEPLGSLRLLGHKLRLLSHNFEIPDNHDLDLVRLIAAPRLSWGFLSFGVLLPLAALGLGRSDRSPFWGFLVLSTAAGLGTTALFFVVGRYRIPWVPGLALLAGAGVVEIRRRLAARDPKGMIWRVSLLALPCLALALSPLPDPTPERWSHGEIEIALAYLAEGRVESAINAFDDARALGAGPAHRVTQLLANGPVHDRLATLVRMRSDFSREDRGGSPLERARWLRQFPETRDEARRELEGLLATSPRNPAVFREWGAWWLGEVDDAEAPRRAQTALAEACRTPAGDSSAAILLALLTSDPAPLDRSAPLPTRGRQERLDLARAIVGHRARSVSPTPSDRPAKRSP